MPRPSPHASSAGGGDLAQKARRIADSLQAGLVEHFRSRRIEGTRRELVEGHRGRPVTGFIAALVDGKPQGFLVLVLAEPTADGVTLTTKVDPLDTLGPDRAIFLSSQHPEVIARANRTMDGKAAGARVRARLRGRRPGPARSHARRRATAPRTAGRGRRPASPCSIRMASGSPCPASAPAAVTDPRTVTAGESGRRQDRPADEKAGLEGAGSQMRRVSGRDELVPRDGIEPPTP